MLVRTLTTEQDFKRYNEWVLAHPQGNLWQSLERKKYSEACGKSTRIYTSGKCPPGCGRTGKVESGKYEASALIIIDRTIGGFSTWEIPRGPLWTSEGALQDLMKRIIEDAKREKCIQIFFSPQKSLTTNHWPLTTSFRHVHPQATRIIDLMQKEEDILSQMHPKGRYNIRIATKHGVRVEQGSAKDIDAFYALLQSTGSRDGFKVSQKSHYTRFLTDLSGSFILMAKHQGKPIAGLVGVVWPPQPSSPALLHKNGEGSSVLRNPEIPLSIFMERGGPQAGVRAAIYYYGSSSYAHRHLMAPYLLQWEAMKLCKAADCTTYDLLGVDPPVSGGSPRQSRLPWLGISDFKSKFGGTVVTYPQEQTIVLRPMVKKMLEWKRGVVG